MSAVFAQANAETKGRLSRDTVDVSHKKIINNSVIYPLQYFSTYASGAEQMPEANNLNQC